MANYFQFCHLSPTLAKLCAGYECLKPSHLLVNDRSTY